MKNKIIALALAFAVILAFSACGGSSNANTSANKATEATTQQPDNSEDNQTTPEQTTEQPAEEDQTQDVPSGTVVYECLLFHLDKENAYYMCEIENTGSMPITFDDISLDVEDAEGNIINVEDFVSARPRIIEPGEKSYIYENVLSSLSDKIADVTCVSNVILHGTVYAAAKRDIDVEVTEVSLKTDGHYPEIIGRVKNNSDETLEYVEIAAPMFNTGGLPCGLFYTTIDLKPGEEKGFDATDLNADFDADYSAATLGPVTVYIY